MLFWKTIYCTWESTDALPLSLDWYIAFDRGIQSPDHITICLKCKGVAFLVLQKLGSSVMYPIIKTEYTPFYYNDFSKITSNTLQYRATWCYNLRMYIIYQTKPKMFIWGESPISAVAAEIKRSTPHMNSMRGAFSPKQTDVRFSVGGLPQKRLGYFVIGHWLKSA